MTPEQLTGLRDAWRQLAKDANQYLLEAEERAEAAEQELKRLREAVEPFVTALRTTSGSMRNVHALLSAADWSRLSKAMKERSK